MLAAVAAPLVPSPASALTLYFIYPDGEGDATSAAPFIGDFYRYVSEKSGVPLSGLYFNDEDEAVAELKAGKVELAVVSPDFFTAHKGEFRLGEFLKTIPAYAERPYEKYYLLCGEHMNPRQYAALRGNVTLFASRPYKREFVDAIIASATELNGIAFAFRRADNILAALRAISRREDSSFVLLSGYEYSVWDRLRRSEPDFAGLKLVHASQEMPSSPLVTVGDGLTGESLSPVRRALLDMPNDPAGKKILATLRLKGFAP